MALIQIRGVSESAHRRLEARAALEGRSLSEYLRLELEQLAALPTVEEVLDRVADDEPVSGRAAADVLREERARRDDHRMA